MLYCGLRIRKGEKVSPMFEAAFLAITLISVIGAFLIVKRFKEPGLKRSRISESLPILIGSAVENGGRMHLFTGTNDLISEKSMTTLSAMSLLPFALRYTPVKDQPPIISSADSASTFALMDKLETEYRQKDAYDVRQTLPVHQIALDPLTGSAGTISVISNQPVKINLNWGSFGLEAALIAEESRRKGVQQVIASDQIEGQAIAQVSCEISPIGEEVFHTPTVLTPDGFSKPFLFAADILRAGIIIFILVAVIVKTLSAFTGGV